MSDRIMSDKKSPTRRTFLQATAATVAAGSFSGALNAVGATGDVNSQIRVAVVGLLGRGRAHIGGLSKHIVALCDCDESVLAMRAKEFEDKYGRKVDQIVDYRKLLERDDIDAISIATPNHTHSIIGIEAAQAGKHVYSEKPISHNVWEGRQLVNAAQKYNRVMQCGTQSRSAPGIQKAVEWVQAGNLGRIQYVLGTCYKPRKSIGAITKPLQLPSSVNYDLWCGPAEKSDIFRERLHYDWHWDFNTGAGDMGNQGIHQMDLARWFLGYDTLSPRVISVGGRLGYEDAGDTPNSQVVLHDYPDAPIIFETRGLPRSKAGQKDWVHSMERFRGSGIGLIVQCENGYVMTPSNGNANAYDDRGNLIQAWTSKANGQQKHFDNFIEGVRTGSSDGLHAPILDGHLSSGLCHTGNISHLMGKKRTAAEIAKSVEGNDLFASSVDRMMYHLRLNEVDVDQPVVVLGESLEMDVNTERFTNNAEADQRLRRTGRKPFEVPDLA